MFILTKESSVANQFLIELRDATAQKDRLRFRKNLERLGEIMAYELSKSLPFTRRDVQTPLGKASTNMVAEWPVIITILRAGLPFFNGFTNFLDRSDCGFIGAFRQEDEHHMTIKLGYVATPSLEGKTVVLIDPMLATGRSVLDSIDAFSRNGKPSHVHIVSVVAAPEGVDLLNKTMKLPFSLWTCALDEKLNHQLYIVPGLGDAGDLSFGDKL